MEGPGQSKLTQLVTHHIFGHIYRNKLLAVMTAKVSPTKSGKTVERRDQVLMTLRSWLAARSEPSSPDAHHKKGLF